MTDEYATVVRSYVDLWRDLRTWGRRLDVEVRLEPWPGPVDGRLGHTTHSYLAADGSAVPQSVTVYCTGSIVDDVSTVLHELAHAAGLVSDGHSVRWRSRLAAATTEATWRAVTYAPECDDRVDGDAECPLRVARKADLDRAVTDAVEALLVDHGVYAAATARGWGWRR